MPSTTGIHYYRDVQIRKQMVWKHALGNVSYIYRLGDASPDGGAFPPSRLDKSRVSAIMKTKGDTATCSQAPEDHMLEIS